MFIKSLKLKNFKIYEDEVIEFNEGLIGIFGKNGSGKSTLFNAIIFGLFGIAKREILLKKDYLLNTSKIRGKDKLEVELDFIFEGDNYKIIRRYSGKDLTNAKAEIYKNSKLIEDDKVDSINKYIINLIGMDREAFLKTTFSSQKELNVLSSMGDEERKKIIRKLLGFEKLDFIEKELKKQGNVRVNLKKEINLLNTKLIDEEKISSEKDDFEIEVKNFEDKLILLESENETFEKELKILEDKESEFDEKREVKNFIEKELISLNKDIENFNKEIKEKSLKVQSLKEKEKSLVELTLDKEKYENLKAIKEKFIQLQELEEIKERDDKEIKEKNLKLKELNDKLDKFRDLNLNEVDEKILEIENKLKIVNDKYREVDNNISVEEGLIKVTQKQIKNIKELGKDAECPTCARKLDNFEEIIETLTYKINMHKDIIEKLDIKNILNEKEKIEKELKEIKTIKEDMKTKIIKRDNLKFQIENLQKEINLKEKSSKEINDKIREINLKDFDKSKIESELLELEEKYREFIGVSEAIKEIPIINQKLNNLKEKLIEIKKSFELKTTQFNSINYDEVKHKELKEKLKIIREKQKELIKEVSLVRDKKSELVIKIELLKEKLKQNEELKDEIGEKEIDLMDYEKILQAISKFKLEINSTIAPQISNEASRLFSFVTNEKYQNIEVDENFKFYITEDDIKYPIERFSGGEIDLANLILRVAISKVSNYINSNKKISILAFDEIFGSQDEERRENILTLLNELHRDYKQIFVVTHIDDVKEAFDNAIEIKKKNFGSRVIVNS